MVRIGARFERSDKRGIFTTILIYTHIMEKTTLRKGLFAVCIGWICCRGFVVLPDIYADFFRTQSPSVYFFVLEGFNLMMLLFY